MQRVDLGEVPYDEAMRRMATWTAERRAGTEPDRLFLLSHPAVITYGPRTPLAELPADLARIPDPELSVFDSFVACGLTDVSMTSLRQLAAARQVPMPAEAEVRDAIARQLRKQL